MKKLYLSTICVALFYANANAQLPKDYKPSNAVASPTAASLSKQVNQDLNLYTGTVNFSVPLFELNENQVNLPVSMTYSTTGIRVKETGGWLGLGWNLNCGGVITRKVNASPDEGGLDGMGFKTLNYANEKNIIKLKDDIWETIDENLQYRQNVMENFLGYGISGVTTFVPDYAPDEFTFNFMGHSGSFFYDRNGNIISSRNIKVIPTESTNSTFILSGSPGSVTGNYVYSGVFEKFQIITEDGYSYTFSVPEQSYSFSSTFWNNYFDYLINDIGKDLQEGTHALQNTWFLTKITSPDGIHSVEFIYDNDDKRGYNLYYDYSLVDERTVNSKYITDVSATKVVPITLKQIRTPNYVCDFTYNFNGKQNYNLVLINVSKQNGEYIKSFYFDYKKVDDVRALLTNVKEVNKNTKDYFVDYSFEYNEQTLNYYEDAIRNSTSGVDHWGFYNGEKQPYNSLITGISTPSSNSGTIGNFLNIPYFYTDFYVERPARIGISSREPDITKTTANMLKKIINPTGGYKEIFYEANTYSYINNSSVLNTQKIGGGVRVSKIIDSDGKDLTKNIVKTYEYKDPINPNLSSGVIENEPLYTYNDNTNQFVFGQSILPTGLGYGCVTEKFNDQSKVVYKFSTIKDYPYTPYPEDKTFYLVTDGILYKNSPVFTSIFPMAGIGHVYYTIQNNDFGPQVYYNYQKILTKKATHIFKDYTGINSHMRGLLTEKTVYNSNGKEVESDLNTYSSKEVGKVFSISIRQLGGKSTEPITNQSSSNPVFSSGAVYYYLHHFYKSVNIPQLTETKKKVFGNNNTNDVIMTTTSFEYNPKNYQVYKTTTQNSDGSVIEKVSTFALDYDNASMGGIIGVLKNKNMLNHPVEDKVIKNGNIIGGSIKIYNNLGKISELYALETNTPLSQGTFNAINPNIQNILSINSNHVKKFQYKYNTCNKQLEEEQKIDGINVSTIWGHNATKPVAQIINSSLNPTITTDANIQTWVGVVDNSRSFFDITMNARGFLMFRINLTPVNTNRDEDSFELVIKDKLTNIIKFRQFFYTGNNTTSTTELEKGDYTILCNYISDYEVKNPFALNLQVDRVSEKQNAYYTSFEEDSYNIESVSKTGNISHKGTFNVPLPSESGSYVLTYYEKDLLANNWVRKEETINIPSTVSKIIGSTNSVIDEVRLYKNSAYMSSYTYDDYKGLLSENSAADLISSYDYDNLNRLKLIKNNDGNLLKSYNYSTKNGVNFKPIVNIVPYTMMFRNDELTEYWLKDLFVDLDGSIANIEVVGNLPQGVVLEKVNDVYRLKTSSNMADGYYSFKLKGTDNLGLSNEIPASIRIYSPNTYIPTLQLWKAGNKNTRFFIRSIENNSTIKLSDLTGIGDLNIFYEPFSADKVVFTFTGNGVNQVKTDTKKPYGVFGDDIGFTPSAGTYNLTIKTYRAVPIIVGVINDYVLDKTFNYTITFVQ